MTVERILIGVDDERASAVALDWAVVRARQRQARLTLMSAFELFLADPTMDEQFLEAVAERVRDELPDARVETVFREGVVIDSVVAASRDYDLLVVGSRNRHPVRSVLGGSLPYRIAARAWCPTVVVPEDWSDGTGGIVVGVGDDDTADDAVVFAAREAAESGRELIVVHAWQLPTAGDEIASMLIDPDELEAAHREILTGAVARARAASPGVRVRQVLHLGRAAEGLGVASPGGALIVLGTHHRGPIAAMMLGSTVRACLGAGRLPVCVVPLARRDDSLSLDDEEEQE